MSSLTPSSKARGEEKQALPSSNWFNLQKACMSVGKQIRLNVDLCLSLSQKLGGPKNTSKRLDANATETQAASVGKVGEGSKTTLASMPNFPRGISSTSTDVLSQSSNSGSGSQKQLVELIKGYSSFTAEQEECVFFTLCIN
jgi:hypothetical protein